MQDFCIDMVMLSETHLKPYEGSFLPYIELTATRAGEEELPTQLEKASST
jgi:hypothetical protein